MKTELFINIRDEDFRDDPNKVGKVNPVTGENYLSTHYTRHPMHDEIVDKLGELGFKFVGSGTAVRTPVYSVVLAGEFPLTD